MSRADRITIFASFVVTSSIGIVFLFRFWQARGDEFVGLTRAGVFVVAMGLVHGLAAWLYQRQFAVQTAPVKPTPDSASQQPARFLGAAAAYRDGLPAAICQQLLILLISALVLDMGYMFRAALAAAATQLAMIGLVMLRRRNSPTPLDIALIRYSAVPLFLLAAVLQGYFLAVLQR